MTPGCRSKSIILPPPPFDSQGKLKPFPSCTPCPCAHQGALLSQTAWPRIEAKKDSHTAPFFSCVPPFLTSHVDFLTRLIVTLSFNTALATIVCVKAMGMRCDGRRQEATEDTRSQLPF